MEKLINLIVEKTGISEEKAHEVVETVISFFKEKLPNPIAGQIDSLLRGAEGEEGEGGIGGMLKGMAKKGLGSILGKDKED